MDECVCVSILKDNLIFIAYTFYTLCSWFNRRLRFDFRISIWIWIRIENQIRFDERLHPMYTQLHLLLNDNYPYLKVYRINDARVWTIWIEKKRTKHGMQ